MSTNKSAAAMLARIVDNLGQRGHFARLPGPSPTAPPLRGSETLATCRICLQWTRLASADELRLCGTCRGHARAEAFKALREQRSQAALDLLRACSPAGVR